MPRAPPGRPSVFRRAYESAGISPETVELVEAHGTGTKVGDAVELSALAEVYRASKAEGTWCALGSVKSQIGHTKAAAGAAGSSRRRWPLSQGLAADDQGRPPAEGAAPGRTPFYLNTEARPWLPSPDHPRTGRRQRLRVRREQLPLRPRRSRPRAGPGRLGWRRPRSWPFRRRARA